jgi:predicted HD phosphohydrolase
MLGAAAERSGDDVFPTLPEPARRASRAGALLQAASTAWAEGRANEAAQLVAAAALHLPAPILDPERPDPTAAEVWTQATRASD